MTLWMGNGAVLKSFNQWQLNDRAPAVDRQWRQLRKFRIIVSKIKALANLLATSNIYK